MNNRISWKTSYRLAVLAVGALGLAAIGPVAWAQADKGPAAVDAAVQNNEGSVVIHAPPAQPPFRVGIPADKAAEYDAEAAKHAAWSSYRAYVPSVNTSTLGLANTYPGLRSFVPPDQPVAP